MRTRIRTIFLIALLTAGAALAQRWGGGGNWGWGGGGDAGIVETEGRVQVNAYTVRTAREIASHSGDTPNWTNATGFEKDVFSFSRIICRRAPNGSGISTTWSPWGWITDFPD